MGDTILDDAAEAVIDENLFLFGYQSTSNAFTTGKYLSNIRDALDGKYIRVHFNEGLTYTKKIGDLPKY